MLHRAKESQEQFLIRDFILHYSMLEYTHGNSNDLGNSHMQVLFKDILNELVPEAYSYIPFLSKNAVLNGCII